MPEGDTFRIFGNIPLKIFIMLIGVGCIISGIVCLSVRAWIQLDEGLNIEPDETTPESKPQHFILNTLSIFGIVLFLFGIIVLIYSLIK